MARLVASLGASPGVVYETLLNVCSGRYEASYSPPVGIDGVVLLYTSSPIVRASYIASRLLLLCSSFLFEESDSRRLPRSCSIREVGGVELGFEDITGRREYEEFMEAARRVVGPGDVVDVSGGRASMAIALARIAFSLPGVMVAASIIDPGAYAAVSSAFTALRENYNLEGIMGVASREGCRTLVEKYPDAARLLSRLVTGKAKTYLLYP